MITVSASVRVNVRVNVQCDNGGGGVREIEKVIHFEVELTSFG